MAEVHLARTRGPAGIERLVVVKRLLPDLADDRNFAGMFLDEARLAVALSHPHIVQVFDVGEDDGSIFYTMEFMHGRDLRMVVQRAARAGVRVPLGVACSVVLAMCEALEYAHELKGAGGEALGIVHRDVSPHNVFVRYDGVVKVLDFGIAKAANRVDRTATGVLKGKFGYMSPEQCLAQPLDRRSDVYCIAVVLYELTTGRRLFSGNSEYEILKQVVETDPSPPTRHEPGYPSELEAVVLCGLVRDRAARYASAALLGGDLESAARQLGLDLSQRAVAEFMQLLFGDDLAAPLTEASPALAIPIRRSEKPTPESTNPRAGGRSRPRSRKRRKAPSSPRPSVAATRSSGGAHPPSSGQCWSSSRRRSWSPDSASDAASASPRPNLGWGPPPKLRCYRGRARWKPSRAPTNLLRERRLPSPHPQLRVPTSAPPPRSSRGVHQLRGALRPR